MEIPWEKFLPFVQVHLSDAPKALLEDAVRRATVYFCEQTFVYRADLDLITARAGRSEYEVDPPRNTRMIKPTYVTYKGGEIVPTQEDAMPVNWRTSGQGTPTRYLFLSSQVITLHPTPDADADRALFIRAAIKPSADARVVEESLLHDHGQNIAYGALWLLFAIPQKTWSDTSMSSYFKNMLEQGVSNVRADVNRSSTRAGLAVKSRAFSR